MLKKLKKAFTITELVIVIAVIAILAAVLIPTFANVIESANQSAALQSCRNALSDYQGILANNGETTAEMENMVFESNGYAYVYKNGALQYIGKVEDLNYVTTSGGDTPALITSWEGAPPTISGILFDGTETTTMTVTAGSNASDTLTFVPGAGADGQIGLLKGDIATPEGETKTKQVERVFFYTIELNGTDYAGWFTLEVTKSMGAADEDVAAYSIESAGANYSRVAYCVAVTGDVQSPISVTFGING